MTQATPNDYWIAKNALHIEPNALGNPDYIQASVVSGASILVWMKGIDGLDYDAGHNYRRWPLVASPTFFTTHTAKYIYAAIPRPTTAPVPSASTEGTALIVFPSEIIDIYGQNTIGEQIGSERYYYIYLQASLTSSGDNGTTPREWAGGITPDSGFLDTNMANNAPPAESEWYEYSSVGGIVTFFKDLTMKAGKKFINLFAHHIEVKSNGSEPGSISFDRGGSVEKVAEFGSLSDDSAKEIITPHYLHEREAEVEKKYLRKDQNDKTDYDLEMKNLRANGDADIFGNLTVSKQTILNGNVTIGSAPVPDASASGSTADMQHWGKSEWGTFIKGIIGGTGGQIDIHGNAELESLVIRRFLEVPELRYNRVSVHSGTEWFTKGSGIIESVEQIDDTHGKVKLHLEDGEISTIAVDDYCMGIFHNLDGNATSTTDDKRGTMQYSGFCTVYFRIQEITETVHNSEFIYELRPVTVPDESSSGWSHQYHPQPQMTFACYANPNRPDRQSSVLRTTDYTVYLENMTNWTFGADNYYLIMGNLDGFSVWATNSNGRRYLKHLSGNGAMLGNVYMFGTIDQFDRLADSVSVRALPYRNSDFTIDDSDTVTLTAEMLSWDGIPRRDATFMIIRYSDDVGADTAWNDRRGRDIIYGEMLLTKADLGGSNSVQFTIVGTRMVEGPSGSEAYSVSKDIVFHATPKDGAKGDAGEPGTGIEIRGAAQRYYETSDAYYADDAKTDGTYLVFGRTIIISSRPVGVPGAYIYEYVSETDSTTISDATDGETFILATDGHLYVARKADSSIGNGLEWFDAGEIRGRDAVVYALDVPAVIFSGTEEFNISVLRTTGSDTPRRLSYAEATADGITVTGSYVEWNDTDQQFYIETGAVRGATYVINLMRNGYVIQSYAVQCVGRGEQGIDGCIVRRSEWQGGVLYRNDTTSSAASPDGQRYIDEVSVTDLATGTSRWYLATALHNGKLSSPDNAPAVGGNDYWTLINDLRPLRTSFADIRTAVINLLQATQVTLTNEDGIIYGAFGGGRDTIYPLWFGGDSPANARVRFHRLGYTEYMGVGNTPNIRIGTDESGQAVLRFYDDAGNERYNLGYMGLKEIIATAMQDHFDPFADSLRFVALDNNLVNPPHVPVRTVLQQPQQTLYRFLCSYFIDASGRKVKAGDYVALDEKIYDAQQMPPTALTPLSGTFAFFGTQSVQTPSGLNKYVIHQYRILDGNLREQWTTYYDYDDQGLPVLFDAQGSTPRTDQDLYSRDLS